MQMVSARQWLRDAMIWDGPASYKRVGKLSPRRIGHEVVAAIGLDIAKRIFHAHEADR